MYFLNYSYGVHHVKIFVSKKAFFEVIDDLSTEFTIRKSEYIDIDFKYVTQYKIENYYGDLVIIGGFYHD